MLWEIDVHPRPGLPDLEVSRVVADAAELGIAPALSVASARGFLIESPELSAGQLQTLAEQLFSDTVVERYVCGRLGDPSLNVTPSDFASSANPQLVQVLLKPGVMDPVAQSAETAARDFGLLITAVRTLRKYWIAGADSQQLAALGAKILANDAIEQVVVGPLEELFAEGRLQLGSDAESAVKTVTLSGLDQAQLMQLSRTGQLYLQAPEMETIQQYFAEQGREPTDVELETIAQTWSEHCSHKTLAGRIAYRDPAGERRFENMLKETIFAATEKLCARWGEKDWCVSVFQDNAGIVRFDERTNLVFKVETHNHPSALEPYGGANTGMGGVIRDTMGTGLGAKPVCNTDVFCFAPPDTPSESLPPGVLHPKSVMRGVVEGVRDYGNRMGIPTVNGAVYFDPRYLGNPLVYCGSVGIIPHDKSFKRPQPGDLIVSVGGRTGRDGIHGATFSSTELTSDSESLSGGAVQIGNAIQEKKVLDVLLQARDRGLFSAITDCGAGGFSSAVGEMGEQIGAEVDLDRAPVKYSGLSYTEIWISEAQERMVLSVPTEAWDELQALCLSEGVEATVIGKFRPTGRLELKYHGQVVGDLSMEFLHEGRPPVVRKAVFEPPLLEPLTLPDRDDYTNDLRRILCTHNVASKQSIIRQYDHEVQGGSVVKPLVGPAMDGPSDAAVIRPLLDSRRGAVIACGMNPHYGLFDPYHMAASAIDEAVRNCVAVGADPARIAILDNFCWGDCEKSATLGALVRAALACHDLALVLETPFISGKDSLNNEFSYVDSAGQQKTLAIPPSLLISALGQIDDVADCVTMDLKQAGNSLYLVGVTKDELGGSHFALINGLNGGQVPRVDGPAAKQLFAALHRAMQARLVAACHDLSEGGLAVAAAEMAFAGRLGAQIELTRVCSDEPLADASLLFSESNTRLLCEVSAEAAAEFETLFEGLPCARIGVVQENPRLRIQSSTGDTLRIDAETAELKTTWQSALRW